MKATTQIGMAVAETLENCGSDGRVVEESPNHVRITDIPHSGTHILPGGMSMLGTLGNHWNEWDVEYVENGGTVMRGSKSDKDVVITRSV